MPIHVEVVTQEDKIFDDPECDMVVVPGIEGEMGILPHHAPVLTAMGFGELVIRKGNAEERFAIFGGVVDVRPDKVVVLADMAASSYHLNAQQAEEARQRALELVAQGGASDQSRDAVLALRRADLELKISRKLSNRSPVLHILDEDETS